jgi:hypothetical protein
MTFHGSGWFGGYWGHISTGNVQCGMSLKHVTNRPHSRRITNVSVGSNDRFILAAFDHTFCFSIGKCDQGREYRHLPW